MTGSSEALSSLVQLAEADTTICKAVVCAGQVLHYRSTLQHGAGWSCGYECLRMLLSWLRLSHDYLTEPGDTDTLLTLQAGIEAAWTAGTRAGC